jgi:cyanate permease
MIIAVAVVENTNVAMAILMICCLFYGMFSSNIYAITQTMAGPRAAGKWTGVQNGFGNLAGVAAPWFTGWVVQETGQFYLAFAATALIVLGGAALFVVGIGPVKQMDFRLRAPTSLRT